MADRTPTDGDGGQSGLPPYVPGGSQPEPPSVLPPDVRPRHARRPYPQIAVLVAALLYATFALSQGSWIGAPEPVAPGIDLFRSTDRTLVGDAGPIAIYLLRLDPARVTVASGLSNGTVMEAERVEGIAASYGAVAAVNAGFFNVKNGEPTGLLKVAGELVSDTGLTRGVVAIKAPPTGPPELAFDQVSARMTLRFRTAEREFSVPIDGVDTTRERGKLMIYTPSYHADTDTAPTGTEFVLSGRPLTVTEVRPGQGKTAIPPDGAVLSFGGAELPEPLAALVPGVVVDLPVTWTARNGLSSAFLEQAHHVVNGAGLLKRDDKPITSWQEVENLNPATFIDVRHPRTVIGVDRRGAIWLVVIDGRQPTHSVGMTLPDLVRLADRLELRDALNLDGGGSSTMVVQGKVINRPSDPTGPRAVSDAIVVKVR